MTVSLNLSEQLKSSLAAQGLDAAGALYWAAERGVALDLFGAYARLLRLIGREMSDAPARPALYPFGMARLVGDRLEAVSLTVGAAMRNVQALDGERHWRIADSWIKGLALVEGRELQARADTAREAALVSEEDGHAVDAQNALELAAALERDAALCFARARGEGWT